jgi:hypothetical protein
MDIGTEMLLFGGMCWLEDEDSLSYENNAGLSMLDGNFRYQGWKDVLN